MHDPHPTLTRYFFRVFTNGVERHPSEGLLMSDRQQVWEEASVSTGELIHGMHGAIAPGLDWRMDVTDETGRLIYRFSLKADDLTG